MADQIVAQFHEEFKKIKAGCTKAADAITTKADAHEKDKQLKFQKYLESRSKHTSADISRLEMSKEQKYLLSADQEITDAKEIALKAEKREQARVDDLEKNAVASRNSGLDQEKGQDMMDLYQDMLEKLAEMHTVSRQSQNDALTNERLMLEEQVASLTSKCADMRSELEQLSAALDATGYEGLLHETRLALMVSMKDQYTGMKNELLRLRLANHALRIRARTAQANSALEK